MKIKPCQNIHQGKRCFIIASGPSASKENLNWLKNEITIGVNQSYLITQKYDFDPTYMCISDPNLSRRMKFVYPTLKSKVVIGRTKNKDYEGTNLIDVLPIANIKTPIWQGNFHCDLTKPLFPCNNVVAELAIPFSVYLGCNPIYLLGCDCNTKGYAYSKDQDKGCGQHMDQNIHTTYSVIFNHLLNLSVRVYNVGQEGQLNVFPRIMLTSLASKQPPNKVI
jgi:hypothetical protein